jgi:hypothetical protein
MKAIPWLMFGVALAVLMIGAYVGMTQTIDNSTGVDHQALDQALLESLRDSYAPETSVDVEELAD